MHPAAAIVGAATRERFAGNHIAVARCGIVAINDVVAYGIGAAGAIRVAEKPELITQWHGGLCSRGLNGDEPAGEKQED
jgi:hypothetical protein